MLLVTIGAIALFVNAYQVGAQTTAQATISGFAFHPSSLTVAPGTTVTWINQDSGETHTVTSDASSPVQWDSGAVASGGSFSFTFTQPGTYSYHCSYHPNMHGSVTVQSTTPPTAPPTTTPVPATATLTPVPTSTSVRPTATLAATDTSVTATPPPTRGPTNTPIPPTGTAVPTPTSTAIVPPTATPTPTHSAKKTILTLKKNNVYLFSPKKTTIHVGTRVVWKNTSNSRHTVTSTTSKWKFNKKLAPGKSVSYVFTETGTYHYVCNYHPGMKATITVKR